MPAEIAESLRKLPFVEVRENGELSIGMNKLYSTYLHGKGFCKYFPGDAAKESRIVRLLDKRVEESSIERMKDIVKFDIMSVFKDLPDTPETEFYRNKLMDILISEAKSTFDESKAHFLAELQEKPMRDTKDSAYFSFLNCVVKATKHGLEEIAYKDFHGITWKSHAIQRHFRLNDKESVFAKFLKNVCGHVEPRFSAMCSAIGYLLHNFKDPARTVCVILVDEAIDDEPHGGTGKSLIIMAISKIRQVLIVDGKARKFDGQFAFQDMRPDIDIVVLDDVRNDFKYEHLFHKITGSFQYECKNKQMVSLPFEESPKFAITDNYVVADGGDSAERRKFEIELAPHYSKDFTPVDEFEHTFFQDWDDEEWNRFDNFMLNCAVGYLKNDLVRPPHINLERRKLIQQTSADFVEFADALVADAAKFGVWISKEKLFQDFQREYPDVQRKNLTRNTFLRWVQKHAGCNKVTITESTQRLQGSGKVERCIMFVQEAENDKA